MMKRYFDIHRACLLPSDDTRRKGEPNKSEPIMKVT